MSRSKQNLAEPTWRYAALRSAGGALLDHVQDRQSGIRRLNQP
jgi:hypothetical protein